jgi:endonuclease/exonuclease/phosphatase family metal-dependent hydrolase
VRYFNFFVAIILSLLYASGKIPPSEKFNLWITSFVIPAALVANLILLLISLALLKKSTIYYVIALLIGSPYLISTVGLKSLAEAEQKTDSSFKILSYNVGGYQMRPFVNNNSDSIRVALKEWMLNSSAEIKCFQEFKNFPRSKDFNVIKQLEERGEHFYFSMENETPYSNYSRTGILIISKFPILATGDLLSSENGFNRIAYADLLVGQDTLRIINVHLESMGLTGVEHRAKNLQAVKATTLIILSKLKIGVFERSKQIRLLADFIDHSPYPTICVGDFNDLPYSYSYQFIKKRMKNSFEEAGHGFGFTYNGRTLGGLRIDNQFFTAPIRVLGFKTLSQIEFSDHFPILADYEIVRTAASER